MVGASSSTGFNIGRSIRHIVIVPSRAPSAKNMKGEFEDDGKDEDCDDNDESDDGVEDCLASNLELHPIHLTSIRDLRRLYSASDATVDNCDRSD